jgi:hypothetical protein
MAYYLSVQVVCITQLIKQSVVEVHTGFLPMNSSPLPQVAWENYILLTGTTENVILESHYMDGEQSCLMFYAR